MSEPGMDDSYLSSGAQMTTSRQTSHTDRDENGGVVVRRTKTKVQQHKTLVDNNHSKASMDHDVPQQRKPKQQQHLVVVATHHPKNNNYKHRYMWPKHMHRSFARAVFTVGLNRCDEVSIQDYLLNSCGRNLSLQSIRFMIKQYKKSFGVLQPATSIIKLRLKLALKSRKTNTTSFPTKGGDNFVQENTTEMYRNAALASQQPPIITSELTPNCSSHHFLKESSNTLTFPDMTEREAGSNIGMTLITLKQKIEELRDRLLLQRNKGVDCCNETNNSMGNCDTTNKVKRYYDGNDCGATTSQFSSYDNNGRTIILNDLLIKTKSSYLEQASERIVTRDTNANIYNVGFGDTIQQNANQPDFIKSYCPEDKFYEKILCDRSIFFDSSTLPLLDTYRQQLMKGDGNFDDSSKSIFQVENNNQSISTTVPIMNDMNPRNDSNYDINYQRSNLTYHLPKKIVLDTTTHLFRGSSVFDNNNNNPPVVYTPTLLECAQNLSELDDDNLSLDSTMLQQESAYDNTFVHPQSTRSSCQDPNNTQDYSNNHHDDLPMSVKSNNNMTIMAHEENCYNMNWSQRHSQFPIDTFEGVKVQEYHQIGVSSRNHCRSDSGLSLPQQQQQHNLRSSLDSNNQTAIVPMMEFSNNNDNTMTDGIVTDSDLFEHFLREFG